MVWRPVHSFQIAREPAPAVRLARMRFSLPGLTAAPFTPFRPDGSLAPGTIPALARLLAANRVSGAFVCGTTGEGYSLTVAERRQVLEAWRGAAPAGLRVIAHVGHPTLADSRELARHAQESGADAFSTLSPSFFRPAGVAELVAWCREVAAAAPRLPFYYYHIPAMTGVTFRVTDFLREAADRIPNLAGVKFTFEDLEDYQAAVAFDGGRYDILFGRDELLLDSLRAGATGAVGSTYNYMAPIYHRVIASFRSGDGSGAEAEQARARSAIRAMAAAGGLPAGKAIMKLIGVDCGPVRLPLRNLTEAEVALLRTALEATGFLGFASQT
jgi:N-acetylneuraminate lyase